jgi:hypothetical protein
MQPVGAVKVDADRAEQPGLEFQVGVGRRGSIRQYQVEPVQRQFGKQMFEVAFDAFKSQRKRRLK